MSNDIITSIITALFGGLCSSVVGGLLVAIVNHVFTRKKTEAEAEKFKAEAIKITAEAERTRAETAKLVSEISKLTSTVDEVSFNALDSSKKIYDSRQSIDIMDFEGRAYSIDTDPSNEAVKCNMSVQQGVLVLERLNTAGLYGVYLRKYLHNKQISLFLPKDNTVSGSRTIKFGCEAKVTNGSCPLEVTFHEQETKKVLDSFVTKISQTEWFFISNTFTLPSNANCFLQFRYDRSTEPQSLLIRNIFLADYSRT